MDASYDGKDQEAGGEASILCWVHRHRFQSNGLSLWNMLSCISNTTSHSWRRVLHPSSCFPSLTCWFTRHINWISVNTYSAQINKNFHKSLHYNNTNHMPTTIKTMVRRKTKQCNGRTRRNQEAGLAKRIPYIYGDPIFIKIVALEVQFSHLSHERGSLDRAVWKAVGSIHYPIDLPGRCYLALLTPQLGVLRERFMSCTSPWPLF